MHYFNNFSYFKDFKEDRKSNKKQTVDAYEFEPKIPEENMHVSSTSMVCLYNNSNLTNYLI